ncbi:succinate dehydrogenase, hydrophobic membrane anchor protein [Devosia sp. XJ19-1]|uniref:Succinate dehydrogenase hydrophobic membrane anchor subunit n=1 Tax=Devosia ureilytica TaxID=2952754 RepID=A0A9Q4AMH8_9HYPH|nr:succinate dehydrogenase, hydrophobic membrane anchor protein [Devosia ureilytica]MCP8882774.1 succinate dehydrogenase, hydrophobic membrane anchor protein [Devosia ureilytica]MCP8886858.1 succinate dehydrogenase, hydrophobic membrane anchor protein [Devosia ureilytica]
MRDTVITKDMIANPTSHYGNAKASTRHFITQRVTGAINIVFLGFLLFIVVRLAGQDRADIVGVLGAWWVGVPFAVLIGVVAVHMRNGMRDTLEDYMHGSVYRLAMLLNTLFCLLIALAGAGAVLKIVFWG